MHFITYLASGQQCAENSLLKPVAELIWRSVVLSGNSFVKVYAKHCAYTYVSL